MFLKNRCHTFFLLSIFSLMCKGTLQAMNEKLRAFEIDVGKVLKL